MWERVYHPKRVELYEFSKLSDRAKGNAIAAACRSVEVVMLTFLCLCAAAGAGGEAGAGRPGAFYFGRLRSIVFFIYKANLQYTRNTNFIIL